MKSTGRPTTALIRCRELRDNIKYMPAHSPYKIYIIDEVHMLSTAAFNALLKTLEEPPAHVLFFFATTEPHKIPITILSRCQRHDLRRIDLQAVVGHLEKLCAAEKVAFPEESLWLIAKESGGSMRDALSLLDQMISCANGPIHHEQVLDLLGAVDTRTLFQISEAALAQNVSELLSILDDAYGRGRDLKKLYSDLIGHFRNLLGHQDYKKSGKTGGSFRPGDRGGPGADSSCLSYDANPDARFVDERRADHAVFRSAAAGSRNGLYPVRCS